MWPHSEGHICKLTSATVFCHERKNTDFYKSVFLAASSHKIPIWPIIYFFSDTYQKGILFNPAFGILIVRALTAAGNLPIFPSLRFLQFSITNHSNLYCLCVSYPRRPTECWII